MGHNSTLSRGYFAFNSSKDPSFSSLYWNIATSNNCYNLLAPITNSDGSSYTGTSYWRVIYYAGDGQTVLATGPVHNFTISTSATNWDRSMLADSNYLYSALSVHPHFMFNAGNKMSVSNYLFNSGSWLYFSNNAVSSVTQSWWNNSSTYSALDQFHSVQIGMQDLYAVALMYQMSSDPFWARQHPEVMFDLFVKQWLALKQSNKGAYDAGAATVQEFPIVADWLWPLLSDDTKSNTLYAMEEAVKFYVYEDWWYQDTGGYVTNFYDWNTRKVYYSSGFKAGVSHQRYDIGPALLMCLSCWARSPVLRGLMDFPLNYTFAVKNYGRGDEGRAYNLNNFGATVSGGPTSIEMPLFPEAHLELTLITRKRCRFIAILNQ